MSLFYFRNQKKSAQFQTLITLMNCDFNQIVNIYIYILIAYTHTYILDSNGLQANMLFLHVQHLSTICEKCFEDFEDEDFR